MAGFGQFLPRLPGGDPCFVGGLVRHLPRFSSERIRLVVQALTRVARIGVTVSATNAPRGEREKESQSGSWIRHFEG